MQSMIVTVTLNASIDKTYYVPAWSKGGGARAVRTISTAGGKGLNVARVLRQLGHENVAATGFTAGYNGMYIAERIVEAGIRAAFVEAHGESRICMNVIDQSDGSSTEVLEQGIEVGEEQLSELRQTLRLLSREAALVIFAGSLPRGVPADWYAELIGIAREEGALAFLDTSGEALLLGLDGKPDFVKPNEEEINALLPGEERGDVLRGLSVLMERGITNAAITLGSAGAVAGSKGKFYKVGLPMLKTVNAVGSGDAFVAGYAYGCVRGWPSAECLRYGAAAGSANALSPMTGDVSADLMAALLEQVKVEPWTVD
ncbi:1-phosphofructokinase family hexose kinase [Paenibacillus sp. PAMC21692]|uniref:1-phosphofructokinase family hexose kinase n=1 Tax=Paenibacillus sp. PAMC21692 TaxID=2762320 RepID=UPI00164DE4C4|nr:1-phosphofructokinase family hexose kinase [Paenibacillus sp. PAMC21692]QNK60123.1 1-phosphofructokinase family hexose kinase [Paenibacillus sp. PAMC21692]